jgi:hypothetical protein
MRRDFLKVAGVDADWKAFHAGAPSACLQHIHLLSNGAEFLPKRPPEVVGIPHSLHSDQIEIHDRAQKICASWKCSEHLRSRPGDMMKVPDQISEI